MGIRFWVLGYHYLSYKPIEGDSGFQPEAEELASIFIKGIDGVRFALNNSNC